MVVLPTMYPTYWECTIASRYETFGTCMGGKPELIYGILIPTMTPYWLEQNIRHMHAM